METGETAMAGEEGVPVTLMVGEGVEEASITLGLGERSIIS